MLYWSFGMCCRVISMCCTVPVLSCILLCCVLCSVVLYWSSGMLCVVALMCCMVPALSCSVLCVMLCLSVLDSRYTLCFARCCTCSVLCLSVCFFLFFHLAASARGARIFMPCFLRISLPSSTWSAPLNATPAANHFARSASTCPRFTAVAVTRFLHRKCDLHTAHTVVPQVQYNFPSWCVPKNCPIR